MKDSFTAYKPNRQTFLNNKTSIQDHCFNVFRFTQNKNRQGRTETLRLRKKHFKVFNFTHKFDHPYFLQQSVSRFSAHKYPLTGLTYKPAFTIRDT